METVVKKLYESLFLLDSAEAASDWDGVNSAIKTILDRNKAEIVSICKWDERKLAYDVQKKSRGTYILCYFQADGQDITSIERDVQLSERIMRVMILSTEPMSEEDIKKDTPATIVERNEAQAEKVSAEKASEEKKSEEPQEQEKEDAAEDSKKETGSEKDLKNEDDKNGES